MKLNNPLGKTIMAVMVALGLVSCQKPVYHNISTSVQPIGSGSIVVSPSSESVLDGTSVTFQAKTNEDYIFTGWSGSLSGTDNPATVVASSDLNVVANFQLREYPLTLSVEGEGSIQERVVSTKTDYPSGTVVELTAKAADHWIFDHWEGDLTGKENPSKITISAAKSVKAVFVKRMYDLTVTVEGEGAVQEKVVETKGSYQEGTVVELTATPATGWSFDHWGGDLSGTENPSQIEVVSPLSVKAVFVQKSYQFHLKVVGPGVVNETLLDTKAGYAPGTMVQLTAISNYFEYDTEFLGWSGDLSGKEEVVTIPIEKNTEITATFGRKARKYSKYNLKAPWISQKRLHSGVDLKGFTNDAADIITLDYNGDGYVDVVTTVSVVDEAHPYVNDDCPVRFYLGGPDGLFTPDPLNDMKLIAEDPRKLMSADFNDDGIPDFMTVGHGYDSPPYPGEYTVALLSRPDGSYYDVRFTDLIGYYHGSTLGDFDNDGDVDVFLMDSSNKTSAFLINDGTGNFTANTSIVCDTSGKFTCDLYDLDQDGFLDLILGNEIVWGNGVTFADNERMEYVTYESEFELALDFDVFDLNQDGIEELILSVTDDYKSRRIQIMERSGRTFADVTNKYFSGTDYIEMGAIPVLWVDIEELDGNIYLVGRIRDNGERLYQLIDGKFVKLNRDINTENGIVFYYDGPDQAMGAWNAGCADNPYAGSSCIRFSNWPIWYGWSYDYEDWIDFSEIEKQGYVFEFAIKNSDPDLVLGLSFETRLQTDPWYFPSYGYTYLGSEHKCDGSWELIQIPLSSMKCDPEWTGYYWNTIKTLNIQPGECHGKDFYLDEIRIRKVLPNDQ